MKCEIGNVTDGDVFQLRARRFPTNSVSRKPVSLNPGDRKNFAAKEFDNTQSNPEVYEAIMIFCGSRYINFYLTHHELRSYSRISLEKAVNGAAVVRGFRAPDFPARCRNFWVFKTIIWMRSLSMQKFSHKQVLLHKPFGVSLALKEQLCPSGLVSVALVAVCFVLDLLVLLWLLYVLCLTTISLLSFQVVYLNLVSPTLDLTKALCVLKAFPLLCCVFYALDINKILKYWNFRFV